MGSADILHPPAVLESLPTPERELPGRSGVLAPHRLAHRRRNGCHPLFRARPLPLPPRGGSRHPRKGADDRSIARRRPRRFLRRVWWRQRPRQHPPHHERLAHRHLRCAGLGAVFPPALPRPVQPSSHHGSTYRTGSRPFLEDARGSGGADDALCTHRGRGKEQGGIPQSERGREHRSGIPGTAAYPSAAVLL